MTISVWCLLQTLERRCFTSLFLNRVSDEFIQLFSYFFAVQVIRFSQQDESAVKAPSEADAQIYKSVTGNASNMCEYVMKQFTVLFRVYRLNAAEANLQSEVENIQKRIQDLRVEAKKLIMNNQKQAVRTCVGPDDSAPWCVMKILRDVFRRHFISERRRHWSALFNRKKLRSRIFTESRPRLSRPTTTRWCENECFHFWQLQCVTTREFSQFSHRSWTRTHPEATHSKLCRRNTVSTRATSRTSWQTSNRCVQRALLTILVTVIFLTRLCKSLGLLYYR